MGAEDLRASECAPVNTMVWLYQGPGGGRLPCEAGEEEL